MKPLAIASIILAVTLSTAADDRKASMLIQAGQAKETVQGDLKAAIKLYGQAVKEAGANRALVAKSLLGMAECYQEMGAQEATKIYEQLVRDYADQKEAVAEARARLSSEEASHPGVLSRQVWNGPKVRSLGSSISPDGHFITFTDWDSGDLAIHDLTTGADRRLTNNGPWTATSPFADEAMFSPDGGEIAYDWYDGKQRGELRVIGVEAASATPRVLYRNQDIQYIAPFDWSPDGKWIAVNIQRDDRTVQIGLVNARTGALQVLKSGEWSGEGKLAFSPDSRFLAFDRPDESREQRDIFVLAVDGSREIPAVVHPAMDMVVGWSGTKLLFTSDRTGVTALWAVTMRDGSPQGAPEIVKSNFGPANSLGLARSGALYYAVKDGGPDIYTASIDFASGKLLSSPTPATSRSMGSNRQPDWSPNGRSLVYVTVGTGGRFNTLTVQSLDTGSLRQIQPMLAYIQWPRWSPDGQEFLASGVDLKGRAGVYRINAKTGDAQVVVPFDKGLDPRIQQWSPDGKHIYYGRSTRGDQDARPGDLAIVERDLVSGRDREVFRKNGLAWQSLTLSPDGRYMAAFTEGQDAELSVIPIAGGEPRQLTRLPAAGFTAWTPDSRAILVSYDKEIWMVPVAGGPIRKMQLGITDMRGLRVRPGGNEIAFFKPPAGEEIWALENFAAGKN